jgi:methylenetetrahydrofolate reductase (NADPH)
MRSRSRLADTDARRTLRGWLERPRFEVLPVAGVVDEIAGHLATPVTITVTASPARGLGATLDVAEQIAGLGHRVVPHLSARLLHDEVELKEIVDRLYRTGIRDAFVIAGDAAEPVGAFDSAVGVLEALARLDPELGVGVAGYPESHPRISDDVTIQAMWDKREYASYVVSQVCFDAGLVREWIARLRARGVPLPVLLGVPGPVPTSQLLRAVHRIGVGESMRFLAGHARMLRLARPGAYDPVPLLTDVAAPGPAQVAGLHLYTFNAVAATEAWRRHLLDVLDEESP